MKIIAVKVFQLKQLKRRNLKKNSGLNGNRTHDLLIAQLVRALHRYRRGHGFDSRSSLNFFFQVSSFQLLKLKHLHCDDLHIVLSYVFLSFSIFPSSFNVHISCFPIF